MIRGHYLTIAARGNAVTLDELTVNQFHSEVMVNTTLVELLGSVTKMDQFTVMSMPED